MKYAVIYNKKEWDEFKVNTTFTPASYPLIAWHIDAPFGSLGSMTSLTQFFCVPDTIPVNSLEAWTQGFIAGAKYFGK